MRSVPLTTLRRVNRWKLAGVVALLVTALVALLAIDNLLVSSLLAFVVAYIMGPPVNALERTGVSRGLATTAVFLATGALLAAIGFWVAPYFSETLSSFKEDSPRLILGVGRSISELESRLHAISGLKNINLTTRVETFLTSWTSQIFETLPRYVMTIITVTLLGPFLAFFMVKDGRLGLRGILGLVPNHLFETALSLLSQINQQVGQFVRARLLEGFVVGLVTTIGLMFISFPYALLLGLFAAITNLVPYIGPILGAVPAFVMAAANGYSSLDLALLAAVYMVAQLIDAGFLIPVLVAKIVDLHPVTVIVVMIAGAQVLGVIGMIISIPVASTLKVTFSTIYRHLIDTRT